MDTALMPPFNGYVILNVASQMTKLLFPRISAATYIRVFTVSLYAIIKMNNVD